MNRDGNNRTPSQRAFGKIGLPSSERTGKATDRLELIKRLWRKGVVDQRCLMARVRALDRDSAITARIPDELLSMVEGQEE
jgi:hypothetical protein